MKKLVVALAAAMSFAPSAFGDDIFKGMRGPTRIQTDGRVVVSRNERGVEALTNMLIGKYWDGDTLGKWGFVTVPYKFVRSDRSYNNGFGDVTLGAGPRGRIGNFHFLPYASITLPTGDTEDKNRLGSGRYDKKVGCFTTYLSPSKKFDVDGSFEYNSGTKETSAGIVAGVKIKDKFRAAAGFTYFDGKDKYATSARGVIRYTNSKKLHFELIGDYGIRSEAVPRTNSLAIVARRNF